jgi:hypothetical protein
MDMDMDLIYMSNSYDNLLLMLIIITNNLTRTHILTQRRRRRRLSHIHRPVTTRLYPASTPSRMTMIEFRHPIPTHIAPCPLSKQ